MKIIIFDFDGVILDSENSHFIAFNEGLKNLNINISEDEYYSKYISLDDRGVITNVVNDKNISVTNEEIDMIIKNKNDYFESRLIDNSKLFPGVEELIIQLSKNFVLCIGSGANITIIDDKKTHHYSYNNQFSKSKDSDVLYSNKKFKGKVAYTIVNGSIVYDGFEIVENKAGKFINSNKKSL